MDDFEKELLHMMHEDRDAAEFESGHRELLRAGVRHARRRRAVRAAGSVLSAGLVAAVAVTALGAGHHRGAVPAAGGSAAVSAQAATSSSAVQLLERVAYVAADRPAPAVRDDQYVYIRSKTVATGLVPRKATAPAGGSPSATSSPTLTTDDMQAKTSGPKTREIWLSVDGSRPGQLNDGELPIAPTLHPGLNAPTYRYLAALPTDPAVLLAKIYAETKGMGNSPDEEAFVTIGDLLREQIAPPQVSSALYRAAAKIPGVKLVDDAVDADGRHGVAVAFTDVEGISNEWIFDKGFTLLGERRVLSKDTAFGKKGQVLGATAVLERAVVDRAGRAPGHNS